MNNQTRIDTTNPTRLDEADGKTRLDGPDAAQSQAGSSILPSRLATQYRVVSAFQTMGAEADLYLVERVADGGSYVLKLYRRGLKPKAEVIEAIRKCDREHVVKTIGWGESDGLWYEILEYGSCGTLRDLLRTGRISEHKMLAVVRELAGAIDHIHQRKIIHRDLKPENVLVRSSDPLDLVLTDFGIASLNEATQHFTTRSRTIKYGAPEAAAGAVGNASDYWSLGLIVLEGLSGRHPFDGLSDLSIAVQLATSKVDVSGVKNLRWRGLCQGLLTRNPKARWGIRQITDWLAGKMPPVEADEIERPSQKPYKILRRECWTAAELALELARNWGEGEKHLARGLILPWLRDELRDQDTANLLIDLTEDRELTNEDRLLRLIVGLGKGLPPIWRGLSLDQGSLISSCKGAIEGDVGDAALVSDIYEKCVLDVWGKAGNEECAQWQKLWVNAAKEFPRLWKQIADQVELRKTMPDKKSHLPVLLLLILSAEYRTSMERELSSAPAQLARCNWLQPILANHSYAALLSKHSFLGEAKAAGEREIQAAKKLLDEIKNLERDYISIVNESPELASEVAALKNAIEQNRANEALSTELPVVRRKLFNLNPASKVK